MSTSGVFQIVCDQEPRERIIATELYSHQNNGESFSLYGDIILGICLEVKRQGKPSIFMDLNEAIDKEYVEASRYFKTMIIAVRETRRYDKRSIKYKYENREDIPTRNNTTIHVLWGFLTNEYLNDDCSKDCRNCAMIEINKTQEDSKELLDIYGQYNTGTGITDSCAESPCKDPMFLTEKIKYFENLNYGPLNPPTEYAKCIAPPDKPLFRANELMDCQEVFERIKSVYPNDIARMIVSYMGNVITVPTGVRPLDHFDNHETYPLGFTVDFMLFETFGKIHYMSAICIIPLGDDDEPIRTSGSRSIDDNIAIIGHGVPWYKCGGDVLDACYNIKYPNEQYLMRMYPFTGCPDLLFDYDTNFIPMVCYKNDGVLFNEIKITYTADDPRIKKWRFVILGRQG